MLTTAARHMARVVRGAALSSSSRSFSAVTLPDLEYDYGALEPHISAEIMEIHHSKHHNACVLTVYEIIGNNGYEVQNGE